MLEAYSVLNALARETSNVRLGTLVTGVTYRNPAFLTKIVTTLDVISGGRAIMGIGAAWNESEHIGFGYTFPPVKERMDRLEEAVAIAKGMFKEKQSSFEGKYSRVENVYNVPAPIQSGGPKILVGGGGEQRTLRIAAKYADMTHWFPTGGLATLNHKTEVLAGYCEQIGRDPAEIERTMGSPVVVISDRSHKDAFMQRVPEERRAWLTAGGPEQCADALRFYVDAGFTGFTFNNNLYSTPSAIQTVGETLRLLTDG
jgi:alkanesulfonate monooxygenase SsuD/methylene tetrahydromethanopterin reductase-like flavin-dependent oxidoreductase (luciferase family)